MRADRVLGPARLGWLSLAVAALAVALGDATRAAEPERYEFAQVQMGVSFSVTLYADDQATANRAAEAAFARVAELDKLLSDYRDDSDLSRFCREAVPGKLTPISTDLSRVLDDAQELAERTDGAFDVTVGPYVRLWRRARRQRELPSAERLEEARALVGYRKLHVDTMRSRAKLDVAGMQLDLGGIAKGYAADEAIQVLRSQGIDRALVAAAGDIVAADPPPGEEGWRVGIAPLEADGPPSRYLRLANRAVSTSGDAFQYVELAGRRYSHIIDPRTGQALTERMSVTVVAPNGITADSLATAASVLGPEQGLALIESTDGAEGLFVRMVDEQVETRATAGFDR